MSRQISYQSLQPNGLPFKEGSVSLLPVFSTQPSFPARPSRYIGEGELYANPSYFIGYRWLLATLAIRKQLDNPRLKKIKDKKSGQEIDNPDQREPVIGLLCRDVLQLIIYFLLGVHPKDTGVYKNTQGELLLISRQKHLMACSLFAMRSDELSDIIFNDLIVAVKSDDRKRVEYILKKNPQYLTLQNSDGQTALALALRTDNYMLVQMMETYFEQMPEGRSIMLHQINAVFP